MKRTSFGYGMRSISISIAVAALTLGACGPKTPPISQLTSAQLWERGIEAYNEEDWDEAITYFDRFALVGGTDPRVNQARFYVAQGHFERREYVTAAGDFARLATDLGQNELADEARFMACRSYEELSPKPQLDQEYSRAAIDHCGALVQYFPDSEYAGRAAEIVDRMWSKLAEKVYRSGEWYFGRRAYDSAIVYYDEVVEKYPQTGWAPEALGRLVEIYEILGWDEEREEARERLLRDYPESAAARGTAGALRVQASARRRFTLQ